MCPEGEQNMLPQNMPVGTLIILNLSYLRTDGTRDALTSFVPLKAGNKPPV